MDRAEYWATKSPLPEYHSIVFDHPSFEAPIRLVANQFEQVTLGGEVHTPAGMTIKQPDRQGDSQPKLALTFPRQVVGRDFKRQLQRIAAASVVAPISVTYLVYLGDTVTPQLRWDLYVAENNGITFGNTTVNVSATTDQPLRRAVAPIYDPTVFTGLELI